MCRKKMKVVIKIFVTYLLLLNTVNAGVLLDGKLDEAQWKQAKVFSSFVVSAPNTGAKPQVDTEVKFMTNHEGLFIGFTNEQSLESRSRKYSAKDQYTSADFNTVVIDFSGQGDTVYEFAVTLGNGSQDGVFSRNGDYDSDWEGAWDFKTSEDDTHWYTEIFIPWAIAPFAKVDDINEDHIKLYFSRYFINEAEQYSFPDTSSSKANFVQSLHRMNVSKPRGTTFRYFPYISLANDIKKGKQQAKIGLDVLWKPTVNQQVTLAINPDFGQAESDELIANFSAVETLYSDKRAFFTENQSLFDIGNGGEFELINTRRMGGNSDGATSQPSDITFASKYLNTSQSLDLGAMFVQEDDGSDHKGKQFSSVRWLTKHDDGYLGQIINWVDRPTINRSTLTSAIDFGYWFNDLSIDGKVVFSDVDDRVSSQGWGSEIKLSYQASRQWETKAAIRWFDDGIDLNDMGYLSRNNYRALELSSDYFLLPQSKALGVAEFNLHTSAEITNNGEGKGLPQHYSAKLTSRTFGNYKVITNIDYSSSGIDDLITRGNGDAQLNSRQAYGVKFVSPYSQDYHYELSYKKYQEGIEGWAEQATFNFDYSFSDSASIKTSFKNITSDDWLIGDKSGVLKSYQRDMQQVSANFLWLILPNQELSFKAQWYGLTAENGVASMSGDRLDSNTLNQQNMQFKQSQLTMQLRYRYRFAALSDIYVVYVRNGSYFAQDDELLGHNKVFKQQFNQPSDNLLMFKARMMF